VLPHISLVGARSWRAFAAIGRALSRMRARGGCSAPVVLLPKNDRENAVVLFGVGPFLTDDPPHDSCKGN
jgi:hypothetical protein